MSEQMRRLGYQQAIDDLMNFNAFDHIGHNPEGDDACELCRVAVHCSASAMAMLTSLGLAPPPEAMVDYRRRVEIALQREGEPLP